MPQLAKVSTNLDASQVIFQQDNALIYTIEKMNEWFLKQSLNMNSIENLWVIFKKEIILIESPF